MSKILRKFQKIFGSSSGLNEIAQYGSLADGTPNYTTDPEVIQGITPYLRGWFGAVIGNNSPAMEDANALDFLFSYQLSYLMQQGIPEWDDDTTYFMGSFASDATSGKVYISLTNNNLNNLLTDPANWTAVGGAVMAALGDLIYGGVNGATTKLPGNTVASKFILSQTGDGTNSAAPVWIDGKDLILPTGMISPFGVLTTIPGWLLCNGDPYLNADYPALSTALGGAYGAPDGTHFNVPDLRGRFLRGVSAGTGRDPDAASRGAMNPGGFTGDSVGSVQSDDFRSHNHTSRLISGPGGSTAAGATTGALTSEPTSFAGGNETRPINAYVWYYIKT